MTDDERGPGWWIASDGRWYPPELHPSVRPDAPSSTEAAAPLSSPGSGTDAPRHGPGTPSDDRRRVHRIWFAVSLAVVLALAGTSTAVALRHDGPAAPRPSAVPLGVRPSGAPPVPIPVQLPTTTAPPVPAGATLPPPPAPTSGPLVTPPVEQQVVATTWQAFAAAFAEDDVANLEATSTPSVQRVILGWFSCGCQPWPLASSAASYSAPPQTAYPLWFYAELQGTTYDATPLDKQAVFTQAAPTAPWLVAYVGSYVGGSPILGTPGINEQSPAPAVPTDITQAPGAFAAFFQTFDQTGKMPPLPAGFVDDTFLQQIIAQGKGSLENDANEHQKIVFHHAVVSMSPVFASIGGDVVCAALDTNGDVTTKSGAPIVQPPDYSQWGHLLAPGSYSSVTQDQEFDVCFFEATDGSIQLYSNMGGPYRITGH